MNVQDAVKSLVRYGISRNLIEKEDTLFTANSILDVLGVEPGGDFLSGMTVDDAEEMELEDILAVLLDDAAARGRIDNGIASRDLFDTRIMGCLTPRPSEVIRRFNTLYKEQGPAAATDYFYALSKDSDYIRSYRIRKDRKWTAKTRYGELDITINLSKPEKDPRAIAAAKLLPQTAYPKCQLCAENEGYAGRLNHPGRSNHRLVPVRIAGEDWFFQYSPYVYYNEHCIVLNSRHTPMKIDRAAFEKLFSFIAQFPHYFVGSNADLPIVGGSILSHDHFQGGHYEFAMAKAGLDRELRFRSRSSAWRTAFSAAGGATATSGSSSSPRPTACRTTPLRRSPDGAAATMSWISY